MNGLHPKVSAGVVAGAMTSLVVAELGRRGITIAPEEGASLTVLLTLVAGYFVGNGSNGDVAVPAAPAEVPVPRAAVRPPGITQPPGQGPTAAELTQRLVVPPPTPAPAPAPTPVQP